MRHARAPNIRKRTHHVQLVHKLFAIEADWNREKETLLREIKRLRQEVGAMTQRYNNACREIEDMVTRLKAEPPPAVPERIVEFSGDGTMTLREVEAALKEDEEDEDNKIGGVVEAVRREKEKEGKKCVTVREPIEGYPIASSPVLPVSPATSRRLTASKSAPMIRTVPRKPMLVTRKSEEKPSSARMQTANPSVRLETVKDDPDGTEKEKTFAKFVQTHADMWEDVARGFACMLDEEGDVDGLRWYEEYRGEKQWDKPVMEWAREKGEDVTAVHRICWQGRNLSGVELYKVGKQLRLWKKA